MNKEKLIRLQVYLSHNDLCSRRAALELIQKGHVTVNDKVTLEPSRQIDPRIDCVCLNGKRVIVKKYEYIMINKPKGFVTTKLDRHAAQTIYDLLPPKYLLLSPAGRLDKDTEGLLFLTNDGDVAHTVTHPRFNIEKTYFVRMKGKLDFAEEKKVSQGIYLDGQKTSMAKIRVIKMKKDFTECQIVIHEGRKRQVRRMFAAVGHKVVFLKRTMQGPLSLGGLKLGQWRKLSTQEIDSLKMLSGDLTDPQKIKE